jgi:hypothetical protein
MPNDCHNFINCIKHNDPEIIKRLIETLSQEPQSFFSEFIPCPDNHTQQSYWGTKWDVYDAIIEETTDYSLKLSFCTAWSPPVEAYNRLKELGFTIDAKFMESGFDYCGYWNDGKFVIFENASENKENIPEEFLDYFCDDDSDPENELDLESENDVDTKT